MERLQRSPSKHLDISELAETSLLSGEGSLSPCIPLPGKEGPWERGCLFHLFSSLIDHFIYLSAPLFYSIKSYPVFIGLKDFLLDVVCE